MVRLLDDLSRVRPGRHAGVQAMASFERWQWEDGGQVSARRREWWSCGCDWWFDVGDVGDVTVGRRCVLS